MSRADGLLRLLLALVVPFVSMRVLARYPQGQKTESSPQSTSAPVTLAPPSVIGVNPSVSSG